MVARMARLFGFNFRPDDEAAALVAHRRGKVECGNPIRRSELDDPSGLKAGAQHVNQPALDPTDRNQFVADIFCIGIIRAFRTHQPLQGLQRQVDDKPRQLPAGTGVQPIQDIIDLSIRDRIRGRWTHRWLRS